jgi:hypothetical protein
VYHFSCAFLTQVQPKQTFIIQRVNQLGTLSFSGFHLIPLLSVAPNK